MRPMLQTAFMRLCSALTGIGVLVLIGYLFWFVPFIRKAGKHDGA